MYSGFYGAVKTTRDALFMRRKKRILLICLLVFLSGSAQAVVRDIVLMALTTGKAIVLVDNQRVILRQGEPTTLGLRLIKANSQRAIIEVDGHQERFEPGMVTRPIRLQEPPVTVQASATVWADSTGFFITDGSINDRVVRFLVDTGSNHVALSSVMAAQLQLDLTNGQPGIALTASGQTRMTLITLDSVTVGTIRLNNVKAAVLRGDYPVIPLLGASFLGRLQMVQSGDRMELLQK